jgi:hypothetical protein
MAERIIGRDKIKTAQKLIFSESSYFSGGSVLLG